MSAHAPPTGTHARTHARGDHHGARRDTDRALHEHDLGALARGELDVLLGDLREVLQEGQRCSRRPWLRGARTPSSHSRSPSQAYDMAQATYDTRKKTWADWENTSRAADKA